MKRGKRNWMLSLGAVGLVIGSFLGQLISLSIKGEFSTAAILGALIVAVILITINIIIAKRKQDNTPDFDERTRQNIMKFHFYSAYSFLGLLFIALSVISFMEVSSISISFLWIIIMSYMCISGIGTLILKSR
ncbi:hypothetical protein [Ornithinibacillus scapharcae]|uniref:hypothetical protein n=1 Tax=Ornithinibacillus scapharcae TaxID=1147159 RepID=UPI000225BCE0|nr:hypothetical protein [Ornithinibacillus scapharcae]